MFENRPDVRHGTARPLLSLLALVIGPVALAFVGIWVSIGPSLSGLGYLAGFVLIWSGMLTCSWRQARWRGLTRTGFGLVALTLVARILFVGGGDTMTIERVGEPNWIAAVANRIVPERDSALVGGRLILLATDYIDDETGEFLPAMQQGYSLLADGQGGVPSPWAATYLFQQRPDSFDVLGFERDTSGDRAVIFLHGFGGSFVMPCSEVAQASADAGYATFCPSTGPGGRWWQPDSVTIIERTIEHARARGYRHIVLAGLSNGGIGLSRVASRFRRDVRGFIFISGVSSHADPVRRPTLVVHGDRDVMTATSVARRYVRRSIHADLAEFEGGHFVLIERRDGVRQAIADWLRAL